MNQKKKKKKKIPSPTTSNYREMQPCLDLHARWIPRDFSISHAVCAASRRRHYYSLTALLLFSGEDVCFQCIQGKNYNFKTENVVTLFTNHNVNRNIVWIFVSLDFRHHTQIAPCFSSYFWRQCLNDNAVCLGVSYAL